MSKTTRNSAAKALSKGANSTKSGRVTTAKAKSGASRKVALDKQTGTYVVRTPGGRKSSATRRIGVIASTSSAGGPDGASSEVRPARRSRGQRRPAPERGPVSGVGERVRAARIQANLTGEELGRLLGLNKSQVSRIENDQRPIAVAEMPTLATALRVTPQWLLGLRPERTMALAHRLSGAADNALAQARAAEVLNVEDLLIERVALPAPAASPAGARIIADIRSEFTSLPRTREEAQRQGAKMAHLVRADLDLGGDELGDLAELIEMHFAVDVVLSPLGTDVDGLCAHSAERAVIVASSSFDTGHVRFTLAHELGHHLLGDPREVIDEPAVSPRAGSLAERRVSAFAAHLLLPTASVQTMLDWLQVSQADFAVRAPRAVRSVRSIADRYGLSLQATVYQLADAKLLSEPDWWLDRLEHSAPTSVGAVSGVVRPPRRLWEAALDAAQARKTGTGPLAVLLERSDEDAIFEEFLADTLAAR